MRFRRRIADDRARAALARKPRHSVHVNTQAPKRIANQRSVRPSEKPDKHDLSAQLAKYAGDITALPAGLCQYGPCALNFRSLEIIDFEDAIDGEIRADNKKHGKKDSGEKFGDGALISQFLKCKKLGN